MNRDLDPISGRAVQVAKRIGLFDHLGSAPLTLDQLAASCRCSPRGLRPLLYLLSSVGLVRLDSDRFALANGALSYLKRRWPKEWKQLPVVAEYEQLEAAVRSGRPLRPPVESDDDDGEFFAGVAPALFELHWPAAEFTAQQIPDQVRRVLDLGAGSAVWSLALAKQRPEVTVLAVDRQRVLDGVTRAFLEAHGVSRSYQFRAGDYHQVPLEDAAYDLVYLGHLLHADGWDLSRRLLERSYAALSEGGLLVVAEIVASQPRSENYAANVFDLNMLMLTEAGTVFTARELEQLTLEAGFRDVRWLHGPGDDPVLLARKAS